MGLQKQDVSITSGSEQPPEIDMLQSGYNKVANKVVITKWS